jgi:hypothetical protein
MYKEKKLQDKEVEVNVFRISTLLNGREVAEILKISCGMADNLMLRGEIPIVSVGKCWRVRPEDLINYIESNTYSVN